MKNFACLLLILISTLIVSCENEPVGESLPQNLIKKDSELFVLLKRVSETKNDPMQDVVCIDFIYPFKVLIYNSNLETVGERVLTGDNDFSTFLGLLSADESISISYPIQTTLEDGTVFSVANNDELKIAIDSCSREDIIGYCSGLFGGNNQSKCVWKIAFGEQNNNKYVSGFFEVDENNSLKFNYNNSKYTGTWIFLFVNDELHLNINLEGNSQVAQDLNINRKIEMNEGEIKIINTPKNLILRKSCEATSTYEIGETGPANGIVCYDKGSYSDGWRYMEVANEDLQYAEWGCLGSLVSNTEKTEIGSGLLNSASIANYHDGLTNYYLNPSICNSLNNGTVIAQKALLFSNSNYKDWFLPSYNELELIYLNLHQNQIGNFENKKYWTSTQINENNVKVLNFQNGANEVSSKIPTINTIKARAIRYF
jgi:hypothetical protein